jgi:hypothetical protein
MWPETHVKKAERIERSLRRLTGRDYEMQIDGAMLAATHYANMALHILGLTQPGRDMIHTEFLQVIDYKRLRVAAPALLDAIEGIEALRAPYVRGAHPGGSAAGAEALRLLEVVRHEAKLVAPIPYPIVNYVPKTTADD